MAKKFLVVVGFLVWAAQSWALTASAPFIALNQQGRPIVGGTVSVTDSLGVPQTVYSDAAGTVVYPGTVPASGIVQFFGAANDYIVTASAQGTTRQYYVNIPTSAGGLDDSDFPSYGGWMHKLATNSYTSHKVNLTASGAPTTSNDSTQNYSTGSIWIANLTGTVYFCVDPTPAAAIWRSVGSIASINSLTDAAITFQFGTSGTDTNVTTPGGGVVQLNIPSASASNRGLITTGAQTIAGTKDFTAPIFAPSLIVNLSQTTASTLFYTQGFAPAMTIDALDDQIVFFAASAPAATMRMFAESNSTDDVFEMLNSGGGTALRGLTQGSPNGGFGVVGAASGSSDGGGVQGTSTASAAYAAQFIKSVGSSTVPIVDVRRNNSSDVKQMLLLEDQTATTAGTYAVEYTLNGTAKNGLRTDGRVVATSSGATVPFFAALGDEDTGFGFNTGVPTIVDESTEMCSFSKASGISCTSTLASVSLEGSTTVTLTRTGGVSLAMGTTFNITGDTEITGEVKVSGVTGSGKTVCVKSDSNFGVCSDQPNGSGVCTCG